MGDDGARDATGATDGIQLVDKDDAGGALFGLGEQVADAGGADADEHLDKLGARDRKERHIGFASDSTGEQGLAGARRAHQQHAARDVTTEPGVALGRA